MAQATPDHAQLDQAQKDHGNHASYIKGFLWSALLTAVPFGLVMAGGFASPVATALVVVAFAVVQIIVHVVYFLHMTSRAEAGWTMLALMFTVVVVVVMLSGSIWVMYHLTTNMMPQMNRDMETAP